MAEPSANNDAVAEDIRTLQRLGYTQELRRRLSGFSNFAVSLSIICILAGGTTSYHQAFCGAGGASIALGWPLACLFALAVAASMGQVASAFPTAGGLYHWACILGGKGWGWGTAWFNLAGLVFVLASINVGLYRFVLGALVPLAGIDPKLSGLDSSFVFQFAAMIAITGSQALVNHWGIRLTSALTDFSGWWILGVSTLLAGALLCCATGIDLSRLIRFTNYSGVSLPGTEPVWPHSDNLAWLFLLGLILPAYTVSGFDASAHVAEETVAAARNVPRCIVRSVWVSGVFGWVMIVAVLLAIPDMDEAALQGEGIVTWTIARVLPRGLSTALFAAIALAQYLCGLATVTSASRMTYAFARDGGLPGSQLLRQVSAVYRTPPFAIWAVAAAAVLFSAFTPVYSTIATVAAIFLYISYVIPPALGIFMHGRSWTRMGPWDLGRLYRPLAVLSVFGCGLLIALGMAPPNEIAFVITIGMTAVLLAVWFGGERRRFRGPPPEVLHAATAEVIPDAVRDR